MPFPFTFALAAPGLQNPFLNGSPPSPHLGPHRPTRPTPIHPISANHMPPPLPSPLFDRSSNHFPSSIAPTNALPRPTASSSTLPKIARRPSPIPTIPTSYSDLATSTPIPAPVPLSKKRGWEPTFAEPSHSSATFASSSGYLDTPAKYREMVESAVDDVLSPDELPPPAKRRRGLAGSIVSTALSAALIGTAVGLTVYRLWRDRGKDAERLPPPPPYQQGEWVPDNGQSAPPSQTIQVTPPTPSSKAGLRKGRGPAISAYTSGGGSVRRVAQRRRVRGQPGHPTTNGGNGEMGAPNRSYNGTTTPASNPTNTNTTLPGAFLPHTQPEFDFGFGGGPSSSSPMVPGENDDENMEVDDQMNWIGGKLSMLIEEGKRALGREVVVMSDAKEDEVDDCSGNWEDSEEDEVDRGSIRSQSRSGTISSKRSSRRGTIGPGGGGVGLSPPPSYSKSTTQFSQYATSPRQAFTSPEYSAPLSAPLPSTNQKWGGSSSSPYGFASHSTSSTSVNGVPPVPRRNGGGHTRAGSLETSRKEEETSWESRELQESMKRAREAVLARKAATSGMS